MNTNGLYSSNDITLSGDDDAIFDVINANTLTVTRNSTPAVNALLGSTINVGNILSNVDFDTASRLLSFFDDTANTMIDIDVVNSILSINSRTLFNSFLPTSTLTPTLATQLITKTFADSTYGRLASANIWTQPNTFSRGIIPRRFTGDGTDLQISNNAMVNRQTASTNNIGIGLLSLTGDTNAAGYIYNTGAKNIAIGNSALEKMDGGSSCIAIGYQSMQNVSQQRIYGAGIFPSRCIAIGETTLRGNLYGNDQIAIGHNALTNVSSGNSSICIGTNVGNGLSFQGECVFIGSGCAPSVVDNAITAIGSQALGGASGGFNSGVAIGFQSFYNNNNASANTGVGAMSGFANQSGSNNTCIGCFAGRFNTANNFNSTTTIGHCSSAEADREFVIGGNGVQGDTQFLTLPFKTRLACNQSPTGVTINLSFRTNENIILTDATTTTINLPTPTANSIGCKFYINRQVTGVSININPPAGQTIGFNQINGSFITVSPYVFQAGMSNVTLLCIGSTAGATNWLASFISFAQGTEQLFCSSTIPIPNLNYSIPFGGLTTTGYQSYFMDNADLNFNPFTQTLTATNINGNINITNQTGVATTFYPTFVNGTSGNRGINVDTDLQYRPDTETLSLSNGSFQGYKSHTTAFQYLTQNTLITAATTLTNPLRSYYPFTMKTNATYTVTLPEITAASVGTMLTFKRIGGFLHILTIAMSANQPAFLLGSSVGQLTSFSLCIATQTCGTLVAIQSQDAGAGTFTNAAGSTTVNIITQTSGTLSIGGNINLNGNIRRITGYSATAPVGNGGGTGNYIINTAIAAANTNAPYTSSVTYGWAVTSAQ